MSYLIKFYQKSIQQYPKGILLFYLALSLFAGFYALNLKLDASPESLSLENDKDLEYYRLIKKQYGSDDYLIVTYSPIKDDLFSDKSLADLKIIRNEFLKIGQVESVTTILDVPLISGPGITLGNILKNVQKLENEDVDKNLAREELIKSPIYKNALISLDGEVTALLIKFRRDKIYYNLLKLRDDLRLKKLTNTLSSSEKDALSLISNKFDSHKSKTSKIQSNNIALVRQIISKFNHEYDIYIGGVPMIVADSINFIKNDIKVFGAGVLLFIIITLLMIFRNLSYVVVPLLTCLVTVLITAGLLSFMGWPITLVSSNFISLLLIITLSMSIHLMVCYKEVCAQGTKTSTKESAFDAVKKIIAPCIYTAATTIVAFCSLILSDIRPVIDFGYIMVIGISIAFIVTFTLLPALLPKIKAVGKAKAKDKITDSITLFFANLVCRKGPLVFLIFISLVTLGAIGVSKLTVENSFINYYKESTDINKGMRIIDNKLGGTTPLSIIIDAPASEDSEYDEEYEEDFGDFLMHNNKSQDCSFSGGYWFNGFNLQTIVQIHNYLDSLPETGKVMSLGTSAKILQSLNQDKPLDTFFLNIACTKIPSELKELIFAPYLSKDGNQIHFNVRVIESSSSLKRNELINNITNHLINEFSLKAEQIHLNGMLVLYNNILNSLFESQILALSFVFLAIFIMFLLLFQNFRLALIALIPNIIVAILILGIMGWFKIPLDIMTITITAISIGIAVDDTIHYIHRFTEEFKTDQNYHLAIKRSHKTIGKAMYYTTITIAFGFSILIFSNFVPTIYFGILTAISIIIALLSDFMLLPLMLLWFKPFTNR